MIKFKDRIKRCRDRWAVDSACSAHMCGERNLLKNIRKIKVPIRVVAANGSYCSATHVGDVDLILLRPSTYYDAKGNKLPLGMTSMFTKKVNDLEASKIMEIKNVYYVPSLTNNLLSGAQLTEDGKYLAIMGRDRFTIINRMDNEVIGIATKDGNIFYMDIAEVLMTNHVKAVDQMILWHRKLAHTPFKKVI